MKILVRFSSGNGSGISRKPNFYPDFGTRHFSKSSMIFIRIDLRGPHTFSISITVNDLKVVHTIKNNYNVYSIHDVIHVTFTLVCCNVYDFGFTWLSHLHTPLQLNFPHSSGSRGLVCTP